jgi:hypothetical protein
MGGRECSSTTCTTHTQQQQQQNDEYQELGAAPHMVAQALADAAAA